MNDLDKFCDQKLSPFGKPCKSSVLHKIILIWIHVAHINEKSVKKWMVLLTQYNKGNWQNQSL